MNLMDGLVAKLTSSQRLRRFIALGISGLAVLMIAAFVAKNVGRHYYLLRIFEPNAGEAEALPEVVYQGIGLVRANQLSNVALSPEMWDNVELYQRFGEGLYPIRLDRASAFVLVEPKDQLGPSCQTIDERPLVILVKCR